MIMRKHGGTHLKFVKTPDFVHITYSAIPPQILILKEPGDQIGKNIIMSTTQKKGKGHQDTAPIIGEIGVVDGDINLKIAKTPHSVYIMTSSAMLQQLGVCNIAFIARNLDTVCNFVAN